MLKFYKLVLFTEILKYFDDRISFKTALLNAALICTINIVNMFGHHYYFFNMNLLGMKFRSTITALIYQKVNKSFFKIYFYVVVEYNLNLLTLKDN
jgi:hypothetical protein